MLMTRNLALLFIRFSLSFLLSLPLNDPFLECDLCSLRFLSISSSFSSTPLPSINHQITRFSFISILYENLHLSPHTLNKRIFDTLGFQERRSIKRKKYASCTIFSFFIIHCFNNALASGLKDFIDRKFDGMLLSVNFKDFSTFLHSSFFCDLNFFFKNWTIFEIQINELRILHVICVEDCDGKISDFR